MYETLPLNSCTVHIVMFSDSAKFADTLSTLIRYGPWPHCCGGSNLVDRTGSSGDFGIEWCHARYASGFSGSTGCFGFAWEPPPHAASRTNIVERTPAGRARM